MTGAEKNASVTEILFCLAAGIFSVPVIPEIVFITGGSAFKTNGSVFRTDGSVFNTDGSAFRTDGSVFNTDDSVSAQLRTRL